MSSASDSKAVAYDKEVDATYQHEKMTEMLHTIEPFVHETAGQMVEWLELIWRNHEQERFEIPSRKQMTRLQYDLEKLNDTQRGEAVAFIRRHNAHLFERKENDADSDVEMGIETLRISVSDLSHRTIHQLTMWMDHLKRSKRLRSRDVG